MKKQSRKQLKKKADILFSLYIRKRDGKCMNCGLTSNLQCGHIVSRRYNATRWDSSNAMALCRGCHMKFTYDPLGWIDFIGQDRFFELKRKAQKKITVDYELLLKTLRR